MRFWFLIAALVLLAWLGLRVLQGKDHKISISFLLVVVTVTGFFEVRWQIREDAYSDISSELVDRKVNVHCQRTAGFMIDISGYMGYVPYPPGGGEANDAYLRNDTCRALGQYIGSSSVRDQPELLHIQAVHVLTHEAMHMAGLRSESETECAAMQRNAQTAKLLGATDDQALALAETYYRAVYPNVPSEYKTDKCVHQGELDEELADAPWMADAE